MKYTEEIDKLKKAIKEFDDKFSNIDESQLNETERKEFKKSRTKINKLRKQKKLMEETMEMMYSFGREDLNMD
jgi:oligoendopeptidase F